MFAVMTRATENNRATVLPTASAHRCMISQVRLHLSLQLHAPRCAELLVICLVRHVSLRSLVLHTKVYIAASVNTYIYIYICM